jgi:hypothetical protein
VDDGSPSRVLIFAQDIVLPSFDIVAAAPMMDSMMCSATGGSKHLRSDKASSKADFNQDNLLFLGSEGPREKRAGIIPAYTGICNILGRSIYFPTSALILRTQPHIFSH